MKILRFLFLAFLLLAALHAILSFIGPKTLDIEREISLQRKRINVWQAMESPEQVQNWAAWLISASKNDPGDFKAQEAEFIEILLYNVKGLFLSGKAFISLENQEQSDGFTLVRYRLSLSTNFLNRPFILVTEMKKQLEEQMDNDLKRLAAWSN